MCLSFFLLYLRMLRDEVYPQGRIYIQFSEMTAKQKVLFWAIHFPYDFWWRKKYNIPFLSKEHKGMTFEAIKFAYHEYKFIEGLFNETEKPQVPNYEIQNGTPPKLETVGIEELASMPYSEMEKLINGN